MPQDEPPHGRGSPPPPPGVPVPVPPTIPPPPPSPDATGRRIDGKYRLDEMIGSGGMAQVYRATHLGLGRTVAVKLLHPRLSDDPDAEARFAREARSASRLSHPNCVQVLDFGRAEDGTLYMVMEYLEGHDLSRELGTPWDVDRAVDAVVQVLRGLGHAHGRGLVHRDIKPQNVYVTTTEDGGRIYKLVDFGLAKAFSGSRTDTALTQMGLVFGTPLYMSPEQALGAPDVDARADIYAVGVIFYELLAGRPPFSADEPVALLHQHVTAPVPPLPAHVPASLQTVVAGMLAKKREDRFSKVEEVLEALRPEGGRREAGASRPAESSAAIAAALVQAVETPRLTDVSGDDLPAPEASGSFAEPAPVLGIERGPSASDPGRPALAAGGGGRLELAFRPEVERSRAPVRRRSSGHALPFLLALLAATLWSARGLFDVAFSDILPPRHTPQWLRPVHVSAALWTIVGLAGAYGLSVGRRLQR